MPRRPLLISLASAWLVCAAACGQNSENPGGGVDAAGASTTLGAVTSDGTTSADTSTVASAVGSSVTSAGGAPGTVGSTSSSAGGMTSTTLGDSASAGGTFAATTVSTSGTTDGGTTSAGGGGSGGASTSGSGSGGSAGTGGGEAGVRVVGRTSPGNNGAIRFSWPGVNIHARFTGTQVSMDLDDASNMNRFTVVVDGGAPQTVTASGQGTTALASGLSEGTHDLLIWRNTEASMGVSEFAGLSGFSAGGGLLAPPAAPDHRIEVIGDSLSVGAGVEGPTTTCSPNIDAFTNNYLAYGSVAARQVEADLVTIAWSGIGVYRSYSASDPTMPDRYDYAVPNESTTWDFSLYEPQVVVLNLGTNDFGSGNPGQPYVTAYVDFIQHVRAQYASAYLILIDMYGGERLTALESVVSALENVGESEVEIVSFSSVPNNNTACNQHPNVAAHDAMGNILAQRLESLMGW